MKRHYLVFLVLATSALHMPGADLLNIPLSLSVETAKKPNGTNVIASDGVEKPLPLLEVLPDERTKPTDLEATALAMALDEHFRRFGAYPRSGNAAIVKALRGGNPEQVALIRIPHASQDGMMLDPWRTPYDIVITNGSLTVRSSGSNGAMGDADDVVNVRPLSGSTTTPPEKKIP